MDCVFSADMGNLDAERVLTPKVYAVMSKLLSSLHLTLNSDTSEDPRQMFRDLTPFNIDFPAGDQSAFSAEFHIWSAADISFRESSVVSSPFLVSTTGQKWEADAGLVLGLPEIGGSRIWDGSKVVNTGQQDVYLAKQGTALIYSTHGQMHKGRIVTVPPDLLGMRGDGLSRVLKYNGNSISARILANALHGIFDLLAVSEQSQAAEIENSVLRLIRSFFFDQQPTEPTRAMIAQARKKAIVDWINTRLPDPEFTISEIFGEFGVSRATLARDFTVEGGAARFLTEKRLERALIGLIESPPKRGVISQVSLASGFIDDAHFRRAFKQHFGFTPSDALGLHAQIATPT